MIEAWKKAEQDLGIRINPEFGVSLKNGKKSFLFIQDFGGPKGTIITSIHDTKAFKELQELGFYCSALGDSYSTYDRTLFIDTLNDWGFFGELTGKPLWFDGESWT